MGFLENLKGKTLKKSSVTVSSGVTGLEPEGTAPTSIFSLPPELLDQIFGYLLHPDSVKYDPRDPSESCHLSEAYTKHGGTAHSYRFHTNILRINRTLTAATARYMYGHNTFVMLTYRSDGLTSMLHRMDVPIVADRRVKSAHHSFVVQIQWPVTPFISIPNKKAAKLKASNKGRALLLLRDLEKLQTLLRFHCSFLAPKRVTMIEGHEPFITKGGICSRSMPKIVLAAQKPSALSGPLKENSIHEFLTGFTNIPGFGYQLGFYGFDLDTVEKYKPLVARTAPSMIWPRAMWWDRFEVVHAFKQQADQLALRHDYEAARARYEFILCWADCDCFDAFRKVDTSTDSTLVAAQERWLLLLFDCCVSEFWLSVRLLEPNRKYSAYGRRLTELLKRLDTTWTGGRSPLLESVWLHVLLVHMVLIIMRSRKAVQRMAPMASALIALRKTWDQEINEHEAHDHRIIAAALVQPSTSTTSHPFTFPTNLLSAHLLPVRIFDHQPEAKSPPRPDGLVNWQDREHLARLTPEDQVKIARLMARVGGRDLGS